MESMGTMGSMVAAVFGGAVGYYVGKNGALHVASRAIDLYIDAKWAIIGLFKGGETEDVKEAAPETEIKWHAETAHYRIYELNGKVYITFNTEYEPAIHLENDSIDEVSVILKDGTRTKPSDSLVELLIKCAGHGCAYKSGVPTLEQIAKLPSDVLTAEQRAELLNIKKIIINTVQFEEHVIA